MLPDDPDRRRDGRRFQEFHEILILEVMFMKRRLVAYLLVSALAVTVLAGCGKSAGGDAAAAADPGDAAVVEEAVEETDALEDVTEAPVEAVTAAPAAEEAAAVAATGAEVAAEAATEAVAAEEPAEYVDDEEEAAVAAEGETAAAAAAEDLIVDPGTTYTVRFGGNIYSTPEENPANVMYYANPGDYLNIVERLDNYWYKVSYYLSGEGVEHVGYIQIQ